MSYKVQIEFESAKCLAAIKLKFQKIKVFLFKNKYVQMTVILWHTYHCLAAHWFKVPSSHQKC